MLGAAAPDRRTAMRGLGEKFDHQQEADAG